jgi:hypothetical protein
MNKDYFRLEETKVGLRFNEAKREEGIKVDIDG